MSESEKELQKQIDYADGNGEDSSRLRDQLRGEEDRIRHSRNR